MKLRFLLQEIQGWGMHADLPMTGEGCYRWTIKVFLCDLQQARTEVGVTDVVRHIDSKVCMISNCSNIYQTIFTVSDCWKGTAMS